MIRRLSMSAVQEQQDYYTNEHLLSYTKDRNDLLAALGVNPNLFAVLSTELRDDEELLRVAIQGNADMYLFASERLRASPEIFLLAIHDDHENSHTYIEYYEAWQEAIPLSIQESVEVQLQALEFNSSSNQFVSDQVQNDSRYVAKLQELDPKTRTAEKQ